MSHPPLFDETAVAANRRRAARSATPGADFLLQTVAGDLAERLTTVERSFSNAAELHGYTGALADRLREGLQVKRLVRVETDASMLMGEEEALVAPLERVPLAQDAFDLVVSPLSLHLTNDTPGVLIQIAHALRPDGLFLGAMPGAGTLRELRESFLAAESAVTGGATPRVIPFADVRDVGALLQRAGFALPVTDVETYTVRYDDMFALMRDLRAMGMQNPLEGRSRRPTPRAIFLEAARYYAEHFADSDGRIRATFSIVYMSGWRPHESQQKPLKPGSAQVSLAEALGKDRK